jgi:hypothetical protein
MFLHGSKRSAPGFIRTTLTTVVVAATLGGGATALASTLATYRGGGKGALKDTVTIKVSSSKVVSYRLNIETLCGEVDVGGNQTVVWPVTPNAGEPPLKVSRSGAFAGHQHQSTTIPAISHVTSEPAPGTYSFSISGKLNRAKNEIEGRLSLHIETSAGYFCTASNSPFIAKTK